MPQTEPSPFGALLSLSIPSGEELYDQLMGQIEPELLSANLPLLEAQYKGESPEDAKARSERYAKAFEEYDKALARYLAEMDRQVTGYRHTAMKSAEADDRKHDEEELTAIESQFS